MAKYCRVCGTELLPGSQFCGQCGSPVQAAGEGTPHRPPAPPQQPPVPPTPPPDRPAAAPPSAYPPPPPAAGNYPPPQYGPSYPPPPPSYGQPYGPPPSAGPPPYMPPPQPAMRPQRPPKRGPWGCLGCLGALLALLVLVGGIAGWFLMSRTRNMTLGKRERVASETVAASGGTVVVEDPASPIDGLTVTIPEGAYDSQAKVTISTRPIEGHEFGELFTPATPLITIDNGHDFAKEPMTVEIPLQLAPDEFAMAFYYNPRTGSLEGIPLVSFSESSITLLASHFSDIVAARVRMDKLKGLVVETGFAPGVDDWQFTNYGSYAAPGGHCAGQSISAMWYYYEKVLVDKERPLYGRYDNNDSGYGTIDFQADDSWGYRFASATQRAIEWDSRSADLLRYLGSLGDTYSWNAIAYALAVTGEPQYLSIGRYTTDAQGNTRRSGHAIIAYKIEGNQLYVADPNYPGQSDRTIRFENGAFLPYASGANAADIAAEGAVAYTEIRYLAKSALVDWGKIGALYEKIEDGKTGEGFFPEAHIECLMRIDPTTGDETWEECPDVLELDEAQTAEAGEPNRGKLTIRVRLDNYPGTATPFEGLLYNGTTEVEGWRSTDYSVLFDPFELSTGINDLGVYSRVVMGGGQNERVRYNDFRRVKVIYERPNLSGMWTGLFRIEETFNIYRYIEDILVQFLMLSGLTESEQEAREIAAEAIVESPDLKRDRPMRLELEAIDPEKPDRYRAWAYMVDDSGVDQIYEGEATYQEGIFKCTIRAGDGSSFHYTGQLAGKDSLSGTFSVTAWAFVKDALTGSWELVRE